MWLGAWDTWSWCWWPGVPMRQHYKVTMSVHCHKSVPILIWPDMLLGRKQQTNKSYHQMICMLIKSLICAIFVTCCLPYLILSVLRLPRAQYGEPYMCTNSGWGRTAQHSISSGENGDFVHFTSWFIWLSCYQGRFCSNQSRVSVTSFLLSANM